MITFLVGQPPLLFLCIFAVGAVLVFGVLPWAFAFLESRKLKTSQPVRILARADEQHAAIMRGDLIAGTFGMYPPADWWLDEWRDLHMPTVKAPRPIRDSSPTGLALARMDGIVDMMEAMSLKPETVTRSGWGRVLLNDRERRDALEAIRIQ